jgi:CubicO group peptidase (beta-lactamase class C family)
MFSASVEAELASRLTAARDTFDAPGISVSLQRASDNFDVAVGLSSSRGEAAFSADDRVPVSCVMKVLVSLVALLADEGGRIHLQDDLGHYLPELAGGQCGITLLDLLTHTGGYIEPQANSARWGYTWDDFVAYFPTRKQAFQPGTVWSYSHTGVVLLQKAIEAAYGQSFDRILRDQLLRPMGIELEFYGEMKSGERHVAHLHVKTPQANRFEPMRPPRETGFMRYSISDAVLSSRQLARLAAFLSGGFRAEHPHLERAITRLTSHAIDLPVYALGPEGEKMPVAFCHGVADYGAFKGVNGSYVGSTCALRLTGQDGLGMATVINAYTPHLRDLVTDMLGKPFLQPPPPSRRAAAEPTFNPEELEGRYEGLMLGSADATIARDGDTLTCSLNFKRGAGVQGRFQLDPRGRARFVAGSRELVMAIARDPASRTPYLMASTSAFRKCA